MLELLDSNQIAEFSPQRNLEQIKEKLPAVFPCLMSVVEYESAEFKQQGEEFHKVLISLILCWHSHSLTVLGSVAG